MNVQIGKFFDVSKTKEYFDGMNIGITKYKSHAENANAGYDAFNSSDAFRGTTAKTAKLVVKKRAGKMLEETVELQDIISESQKYILDTFAAIVDASPNARIEYDVLRKIEGDFKGFYNTFTNISKSIENLSRGLNSEFGSYAYFGNPNADSAILEYGNFCGGNTDNSGYLSECIAKFVRFDEVANSHIKAKQIQEKAINVSTRAKSYGTAFVTPKASSPKMAMFKIKKISAEPVAKSGGKSSKSEVQEMIDEKIELKKREKLAQKGITGKYYDYYCELSDEDKAFVNNIDKIDSTYASETHKIGMRCAAIEMLKRGVEKEFIVGVLANISCEGTPGQFENSNYQSNPKAEKPYLRALDDHFEYSTKMSNKSITEIGIEETQKYVDDFNKHDGEYVYYNYQTEKDEKVDLRFGIGLIQWTTDDRAGALLEYYADNATSNNPSTQECAQLEAGFLVSELLEDSDYSDIYYDWKKKYKGTNDAVYQAGYNITYSYVVPNEYDNGESDNRASIAESFYNTLTK